MEQKVTTVIFKQASNSSGKNKYKRYEFAFVTR